MLRVTQDPSSGSDIQYVAKITDNGSIVQVVSDVVSVMAAYATITLAVHVTTCTIEPLSVILVKYWI
jgi:hypothetical protein